MPASLFFTSACISGDNATALSTFAVRRSISSFTNRSKCDRISIYPRGLSSATLLTTKRTRFSSITPLAMQSRKSCFASRLDCLEIFISIQNPKPKLRNLPGSFFRQSLLVFRRQNLAGHRRRGLHHQAAHFLLQVGQHTRVIRSRGFAGLGDDLFRGSNGFLRFIFAN